MLLKAAAIPQGNPTMQLILGTLIFSKYEGRDGHWRCQWVPTGRALRYLLQFCSSFEITGVVESSIKSVY